MFLYNYYELSMELIWKCIEIEESVLLSGLEWNYFCSRTTSVRASKVYITTPETLTHIIVIKISTKGIFCEKLIRKQLFLGDSHDKR